MAHRHGPKLSKFMSDCRELTLFSYVVLVAGTPPSRAEWRGNNVSHENLSLDQLTDKQPGKG